jgi:septum site-determining protein MinC
MSTPVTELPAFDLKSSAWTLTVLRLHTADVAALNAALAETTAASPGLFEHEPVVLDLASLAGDAAELDLPALLDALRAQGMLPVGVQGGSAGQRAAALQAGLPEACAPLPRNEPAHRARPGDGEAQVLASVLEAVTEAGADTGVDAQAAALDVAEPGAFEPPPVPPEPPILDEVGLSPAAAPPGAKSPTLVVDSPLRSGQRVYARGGDLVVLSAVSFGAEVIADGHIHVYGPLRGRAIAGASGDASARIFSTAMDPQLVSIAGIYRTTEVPFPDEVQGRPAQVHLDGERIVVEALKF